MFSRSEKKRSYNQEQSQWKHIREPTDYLCHWAFHVCTLPYPSLPLYCVCFWWPFFWMGLKSSWHQRQCTVILDRAKYWHYKKTGYRPTQYLVIQGKNFLFVLQLHWGWNWRKRRFKSSGFTEFCWVGSYNRLLFSALWCRKSSLIDKCFICWGYRF